jgi:hypothetical protein
MVGDAIEFNEDVAPASNVTWYWVTELKVTVWAALIVTDEVITEPVVATAVFEPPSIFQDATLCPVPAALLYTPLDETVVDCVESYQPASPEIGVAVPYVTPLAPATVRKNCVTVLALTWCVADIVWDAVVNVPVVASLVLDPLSQL